MKKMNQSGFSAVEAVLILVVVAILGFTGWFVWHAKQNTDKTLNDTASSQPGIVKKSAPKTASQNIASDRTKLDYSKEQTFFDCFDKTSKSADKTCTMGGVAYAYPATYSDDMIRSYPSGRFTGSLLISQATQIRTAAQQDFAGCTYADTFAMVTIYSATDDFTHLGIGCDSGHRELWHRSGDTWTKIYAGQSNIGCDTVDQYKVPASVMKVGDEPNTCYDATTQKDRAL